MIETSKFILSQPIYMDAYVMQNLHHKRGYAELVYEVLHGVDAFLDVGCLDLLGETFEVHALV